MNLKLKVFRPSPGDTGYAYDGIIPPGLPWRWVIVDLNHNGGWWKFSPWSWPRGAVRDHGRASDGATALRVGLYALNEALKEG